MAGQVVIPAQRLFDLDRLREHFLGLVQIALLNVECGQPTEIVGNTHAAAERLVNFQRL